MPTLYYFKEYSVRIWSNENGEPIHVHVSRRGSPKVNDKFWLCSDGHFELAGKLNAVKRSDVSALIVRLNLSAVYVRNTWISLFGYEKYYK